jgi:hypothetical protein
LAWERAAVRCLPRCDRRRTRLDQPVRPLRPPAGRARRRPECVVWRWLSARAARRVESGPAHGRLINRRQSPRGEDAGAGGERAPTAVARPRRRRNVPPVGDHLSSGALASPPSTRSKRRSERLPTSRSGARCLRHGARDARVRRASVVEGRPAAAPRPRAPARTTPSDVALCASALTSSVVHGPDHGTQSPSRR